MAYELEQIESKISDNIISATSENIEFDVPAFLRELDCECLKVKRAFRHQVVSFENERLIKRYFHFHQESLIDLINTVHSEQQLNNGFMQSILDRLGGLLQYLQEHFPDYFNLDMRMPVVHNASIKCELKQFSESLERKFYNTKVDPQLTTLMIDCLRSHGSSLQLTFRQFYYFKLLRMNMESLTYDLSTETLDVIRILMHCNFNTDHFYSYIIKFITASVSGLQTVSEQLDRLMFFMKFSCQELSNHSISYQHQHPPISTKISDWLSQELIYLKNKQQLLPTISSEEIIPSDFKLNFDLSVTHLAFLFRAFIESGVIRNKNTSELIRFLTKYVKTKKSESISSESFRIKYYSVESGTKDAVKKTLQSVLSFISNFNH